MFSCGQRESIYSEGNTFTLDNTVKVKRFFVIMWNAFLSEMTPEIKQNKYLDIILKCIVFTL